MMVFKNGNNIQENGKIGKHFKTKRKLKYVYDI